MKNFQRVDSNRANWCCYSQYKQVQNTNWMRLGKVGRLKTPVLLRSFLQSVEEFLVLFNELYLQLLLFAQNAMSCAGQFQVNSKYLALSELRSSNSCGGKAGSECTSQVFYIISIRAQLTSAKIFFKASQLISSILNLLQWMRRRKSYTTAVFFIEN